MNNNINDVNQSNINSINQNTIPNQTNNFNQSINNDLNNNNISTYQNLNNNKKNNKKYVLLLVIVLLVICTLILIMNKNVSNSNTVIDSNNSIVNDDDSNLEQQNNFVPDEYVDLGNDIALATVGQIGHGKTELTSAITKIYGNYTTVETLERTEEIKKDGVILNVSTVNYKIDNKNYVQYDFPGHIDIIKNSIMGYVKVDGAILVVSATEGPMAQTKEHLRMLRSTGVPRVVVFLNNFDVVNDENVLKSIEDDIRSELGEYGFDPENTPIIRGNAEKALEGDKDNEQKIKDLMKAVDEWISVAIKPETSVNKNKIKAMIYMLTKEEGGRHTPVFNKYKPSIIFENDKTDGEFIFPEGVEMLMPGDNMEISINLTDSVKLNKYQRFIIKEQDTIVGKGIITELLD